MSKHRDPIELPSVRGIVKRNDGTIEYDSETDAFAMHVEDIRARIRSLVALPAHRFMRRKVVAMVCTATENGSQLELKPTTLTPTNDPELSGRMVFGLLVYMRKNDPAGFAKAMELLRDNGLVQPSGPRLLP